MTLPPRTLYDKLWDSHVVRAEADGTALLYIDRHLVHEVTSPQAYEGLKLAGRKPWRVGSIVATADHNTPTKDWDQGIRDPISRMQVETLDANIRAHGAKAYFPFRDARQGIVHVIGPEQGATLPGMTVVCGDSHTSTHGAFAALAFGIGTSEVEHVLATQCLLMKKAKSMQVRVDGRLPRRRDGQGPGARRHRQDRHRRRHRLCDRIRRRAMRALSMEGRMTLCNMAIEAGARAGMIGVDERTIEYLRGRPFAPKPEHVGPRGRALAHAHERPAGEVRHRRRRSTRRRSRRRSPGAPRPRWSSSVEGRVPDPDKEKDAARREGIERALEVHGARAEHADHRHPHRQGVHRLVHELADRGPARRGRGRARPPRGGERQARAGRARIRPREGAGRARGARPGLSSTPASNGASPAARCASR